MPYGIPCTLPGLLGSLFNLCEFPWTMRRYFISSSVCRWSYGANKIQIHTDVKLLSEFLSCLGNDAGRNNPSLSSLPPSPAPRALVFFLYGYGTHRISERGAQNMAQVLRLLVENEILRLNVWNNPTNDPKRGVDSTGTVERTMTDVSSLVVLPLGAIAEAPRQATWTMFAGQTWQLNPGIAIHLTRRFSVPALENEVTRLVRSNPLACIDVPDALNFLVGDRLDPAIRRDLRVRSDFISRRDILARV